MIRGIFHSAITVLDMDKTLEFYCEILGGEQMYIIEQPEGTPFITAVRFADHSFLEFFYPNSQSKPSPERADHHFALICDDIHQTEAMLREKGVEILSTAKVVRDGNLQIWCRDPNGYRVEIMQLIPDCPQLQRPCVYRTLH